MSKPATVPHDNADNSSIDSPHYLMWFRRDLRIADNTALTALCERANEEGAIVSAVFFLTPHQWRSHDMSLSQVDHIARTLPLLATALQTQLNIELTVYVCADFDDSIKAISELCEIQNIRCVMANHEYEGNERHRDEQLTIEWRKKDIEFIRWHDQCVLPPKTITTNDGDSMYKVFTPFYKKWRDTLEAGFIDAHHPPKVKHKLPKALTESLTLKPAKAQANTSARIERITHSLVADYKEALEKQLAQKQAEQEQNYIDYESQLKQSRTDYLAGETAARQSLSDFIADDIHRYNISRDKPSLQATSHMSAYLTIGVISARQCYLAAVNAHEQLQDNASDNNDINRWISELAWRDFYRHVLADKPELIRHQAYKVDVDQKIAWSYDKQDFAAWCRGQTGIPLVDAAMRCLNATGFMHNRLRMVTAMFLTKDLLIDWRLGERYFMQQLIDGDFASNNGGWQWSASTGTDSAPYFRIMNPFSQGASHDTQGEFIKTWLPELKEVPASILHSEDKMRKALKKGGNLQKIDYPLPMVAHKEARERAIAEFKK